MATRNNPPSANAHNTINSIPIPLLSGVISVSDYRIFSRIFNLYRSCGNIGIQVERLQRNRFQIQVHGNLLHVDFRLDSYNSK